MAEKRFTPGPWRAEEGSLYGFDDAWDVVGSDNCGIASMADTATVAKFPRDREANAMLIAAAPKLLAACESALNELSRPSIRLDSQGKEIVKELRAAIAEALGENISPDC